MNMEVITKVVVCILLLSMTSLSECANILVMLPLPLYSHTIAYMPIIKELAKRGHNVTMVSPFPQEKPVKNINDIVVPPVYDEITDPSMFDITERNPYENMQVFWDFGLRGSKVALKFDAVKKIASAPINSFDLVMTETFFLLEPMAALGHKFRCPVVNLNPWSMTLPVAYFTGNPYPSSYVPSVYSKHSDNMNFLERVNNFILNAIELSGLFLYYLPRQDTIMREYFQKIDGFEDLPYITDLLRATSLTLLDANQAIDFKKPYFKNVVEIGGLTVHNKQHASVELQKYMNDSTQGFIYFSMGSHLPSTMLPENLRKDLFKVFGRLKQNVIMKWDNDAEPNKPKNVIIEKWLPQIEILQHPNCKLIITHGGLHTILEATYYQVPLVGLPLVADQPMNMRFVEHIGLGVTIDVFNTTEDQLLESINTVMTDKKYKKVAIERSSIMKDHPISILDNAIYHIEYLLRHKGESHLPPPSLKRYWYELMQVDVILFLAFVLLLIIATLMSLMKIIMLIIGLVKKPKQKKSKTH